MMLRVSVAGGLLCVATVAHAGDKPLYAPAPDWVVPAPPIDPAKLTPDGPIMLVFDNQQRLKDGMVWIYAEAALRATSAQALAQIGTVALPWMPDKGDLIVHRAEIIRGAEHIDLLKTPDRFSVLRREEGLEQRMMNGMLTATMQVQGLQVGDILRISYSVTQVDRALAGRMQSRAPLLADPIPVGFARMRMLWPVTSDVRWKAYADGAKPLLKTVGDQRELTIAMPLPKAAELPTDAPVRYRKLPLFDISDFADWAEVSKTMAPLYATEGLIAPGGPIAAEIAKITAASSDPRHRAAAALQLVQDKVRYLLMGMDGGNYIPQTPTATWQLKYGDCKAKTLLLLAMLRAMGIEAEPVLASAEMGGLVNDRLPAPAAFDHVLVRATIDGKSLWLDGTDSGSRLADIDNTPGFRTVLPLRAGGAGLMPLPIHANARPDVAVAIDYDQSAGVDMPAVYKIAVTVRGAAAIMANDAASQASAEQKLEMVRNAIKPYVGESHVADSAIRYDAESGTAMVTATGLASANWRREQNRYRMTVDRAVQLLDFTPDRARPAWRDIPVATAGPAALSYRTTVRLPGGGAGYTLDGDQSLSGSLAGNTVTRTSSLTDGVVTVDERVDEFGIEIAPADIAAERSRMALASGRLLRVVAPASLEPRWKRVLAARKNGSFKPIETLFAKVIAGDPKGVNGYYSRASFRLVGFDPRSAIPDLTQVLAIEPSATTHLRRASAYRAIGDDAKALADVEAARALDPASLGGLNMLALLKADRGESKAALALLDERIEQGGKERFDVIAAKAEIQADGGAPADGIATLDAALVERPGDPMLLNNRCWVKGTHNLALDTALKDCTKAIELAEVPTAALDSRAMVYFRMDRLDDALADLNSALDASPDMASSLFLRAVIYKKQGKTAEAAEDLAGARLISPQIDVKYKKYGITA